MTLWRLSFAIMALGLLTPEIVSGQSFSNAYREALEDTAVKYEYLKPKAIACDHTVLSLRNSLTDTKLAYKFYRESVIVQAEVDSVLAQDRQKADRTKNIRTGRKQGVALVVGPPLIYLIIKSFF